MPERDASAAVMEASATVLAFDFGTKRLGVAVGETMIGLAHPLTEIGYFSIGCEPCTKPGGSSADPRAGRWAGSAKSECGIHWTVNGKTVTPSSRASH